MENKEQALIAALGDIEAHLDECEDNLLCSKIEPQWHVDYIRNIINNVLDYIIYVEGKLNIKEEPLEFEQHIELGNLFNSDQPKILEWRSKKNNE